MYIFIETNTNILIIYVADSYLLEWECGWLATVDFMKKVHTATCALKDR